MCENCIKKIQMKGWSNVPPKLLACIGFLYKVVRKIGRLRKFNRSRDIEFKGALSRYSVIFCAILLWGKIMAAVHISKRSALNKCPACRLSQCTLYCVAKYTQLHLKALRVLNDLRTKTTQDRSVELCFGFNEFSPFFIGKLVFLFSLSWSYLKAHLRPRGMTLQR